MYSSASLGTRSWQRDRGNEIVATRSWQRDRGNEIVAMRSWQVRFVFFYRTSYVGLTSRQHLATVIRYADCVKQHFRASRRHLVVNYTSFITRLLWLCCYYRTRKGVIKPGFNYVWIEIEAMFLGLSWGWVRVNLVLIPTKSTLIRST